MSTLRRSNRITKGKPPRRLGEEVMSQEGDKVDLKSRTSEVMKSTHGSTRLSSISSLRKQTIQLELEETRRLSVIKNKEIELAQLKLSIEKQVLEKEIEFKKAEILSQYEENTNFVNETLTSKSSFVQKWVNDIPTSTKIDRSYSFVGEDLGKPEKIEDSHMKQFMARQSISKDLPVFSGEPTEWLHFISHFKETTKICGFTDRENIVRLQKCLKGKARECVQALLNFTQHVDKIIKTLESRFGRPEFIIQDLLSSIRKIPNVREDKLECILDFANAVQNFSVTVETLNCHAYVINPQILNEMVQKITPTLKIEWGKRCASNIYENKQLTILDFSNWIEEIANAVSYVSVPNFDQEKKKKYVLTTSIEKEKKFKCVFCKKNTEDHYINKCILFKNLDVDKRWEWVKTNKVCFSCLGSSHQQRFCRRKKTCGTDNCSKIHHYLLHNIVPIKSGSEEYQQRSGEESINHHLIIQDEVLLRIAPVTLSGPRGKFDTYALFDEASTITLVDEEVADKIGAVGPVDTLKIRWTNSITNEERNSRKVTMSINSIDSQEEHLMTNVRTIKNLSLPVQSVNFKKLAKKWKHLPLFTSVASLNNAKPTILIGQDNIDLIIAREVIDGAKNAPVLSRTKLGWVIHGNVSANRGRIDEECSFFINHQDENLYDMVKQSFHIDNLGVKDNEFCSKEDQRSIQIMEKTTRRVSENRWETGLIWKHDNLSLPNSYPAAFN